MLPLLHLKAERNPSAGQAAHSFELSRIFILRKYNWDFKNIADMKNLKHKKMMEIINAEGQWSAGGRIKSEAPTKGSSQNKFSVKFGDFYAIFYVIFGEFFVGTGETLPYCDKIPTFMGSSEAN